MKASERRESIEAAKRINEAFDVFIDSFAEGDDEEGIALGLAVEENWGKVWLLVKSMDQPA